jgi:uncharacterized protein
MVHSYIVKLTNACDLACPHCYYMVDAPAKGRIIADDVLWRLFDEIAAHSQPGRIKFYWHGGEPTLLPPERFKRILDRQRSTLSTFECDNGIQTNAFRLSQEWIDLLVCHEMGVGVSIDGTSEQHNSSRFDHKRRGTFSRVVENVRRLLDARLSVSSICVVNPLFDGGEAFRAVADTGVKRMDFLLPMRNWDSYDESFAKACGLYLIQAFDAFVSAGRDDIYVKVFQTMTNILLGKPSTSCMSMNSCDGIVTIEVNGDVGLCDDLKPTGSETYLTQRNILRDGLPTIRQSVSERFVQLRINSGVEDHPSIYDRIIKWCPATRYRSDYGFMDRSVDLIPLGMLMSRVEASLKQVGLIG